MQQPSQENILKGFKAFKTMTKESERTKAKYFGGKEPFWTAPQQAILKFQTEKIEHFLFTFCILFGY